MPTFDRAKARAAGMSDDAIAEYVAKRAAEGVNLDIVNDVGPEGPAGAMSPEEMYGPRGMTRRFSRAIPFAAGMVGAVLGGMAGPTGARVGSVLGGAGGRIAERALFNEPQSVRDVLSAGAEQGVLETSGQLIAGVPGSVSKAAGKLSGFMKGRAATQAVARSRAANAAGDMSADISRELPRAKAERRHAGMAIERTLKENEGQAPITLKEVIDEVLAGAERNGRLPDEARKKMLKDMREEFRSVIPEFTRGGMSGREVTFKMGDANYAKRAFDIAARQSHEQAAKGVYGNPDLRRDISNAFRSIIEKRIPEMGPLNERYQAARLEDQSLRKMARSQSTGRVGALRQTRRERVAAALSQLPGEGGSPIGVGLRGLEFKVPRTAAAADILGNIANDPLTRVGFQGLGQVPRGLDLIRALTQSPDEYTTGGNQ